MSGVDDLRLDPDGFLDMTPFTEEVDLSDTEVVDLRAALHADPVEEPTAEEWAGLLDGVLSAEPVETGPFDLDDPGVGDDPFDPGGASDEALHDAATGDDPEADDADPEADDADGAGGETSDDLDLDGGDASVDALAPDVDGLDTELGLGIDDDDGWSLDDSDADPGPDDLLPDDAPGDALPDVMSDLDDLL